MSIWPTIIGGALGYMLGGPLGALLGASLGIINRKATGNRASFGATQSADQVRLAFSTALIALGAKMAKADGVVTKEEIQAFKQAFRQIFKATDTDMQQVAKIFNQARMDATGFEPFARQIAGMASRPMLEELLRALLFIAHADGTLHPNEKKYLRSVAAIFGFSSADFERILQLNSPARDSAPDPWQVLGLSPDASNTQIKAKWRKLAKEHHPDRLIAEGLPQEMIEQANHRLAEINRAYDRICKERNI